MWKWRHLHRQDWFLPLPLPAELWRRHMRERWEWEYSTQTHTDRWRSLRAVWGLNHHASTFFFFFFFIWDVIRPRSANESRSLLLLLCAATVYELVKIPSHLMQKKIKMFVANCAGGNNPDQCAASVTAARRGTRYHRGPSLSSAISRCICACHGCCWVTDTAPKLLQHISQHLHRVFFFQSASHTHTWTHPYVWLCVCVGAMVMLPVWLEIIAVFVLLRVPCGV